MKRSHISLAVLALALCGCAGPEVTASSSGAVPSPSSPTSLPQPSETPETPGHTQLEPNAACHEVSFYLDPSLAGGYTCETAEAEYATFDEPPTVLAPAHTMVRLTEYAMAGSFSDARLDVYAIGDNNPDGPEGPATDVTALGGLISGASAPEFSYVGAMVLPYRPYTVPYYSPNIFFSNYTIVASSGSSGVRYLTEYRQDAGAPANGSVIYTYQGLSSDGRYWIAASLTINHPSLATGVGDWPDFESWDQWCQTEHQSCIEAVVENLNSQSPRSFFPTLEDLDALVSSITVTP